MSQDFKCVMGLHKYKVLEVLDIKDSHDLNVGKTFVLQCDNCGKIKKENVFTEFNHIR